MRGHVVYAMASLTKGEYTGLVVLVTMTAAAFLAGLAAGPSGQPSFAFGVGLFMMLSAAYLAWRALRRVGGAAYAQV